MSKLNRKSNKGFTLIELMIVVAIIGILAAIAIPNFLRFQLKAKSSEGKVNIAAIRTAEESYLAEFGSYVTVTTPVPAAIPGSIKVPFLEVPAVGVDFNTLGWAPEGQVFFQYAVLAVAGTNYTISAAADIDGDGVAAATRQAWGYVKPVGLTANGSASAAHPECILTGVWNPDPAILAATALNTVGPCSATSGQSIF
jgi:type IV pilus assembly protein PilA